ncbi:hypothetical protein [Peribacillus butanolivorans]|uniref:hypothetical protein n=1 Tax=Peribacillus butanolivorans TaxID=421767 RepID=UPI0035DC2BF9
MATAENGNKQITIFYTNDMHGHLLNNSNQIGIDIIASMKNMDLNSLLIDAGDATQGLPFANLRKGKDVITFNKYVNGTLIAQTGSASANVGKVDITLKMMK